MSCSGRTPSIAVLLATVMLAACAQAAPASPSMPTSAPTSAPTRTAAPAADAAVIQRSDEELAARLDDFLTKMRDERLFSGIVTVKRGQTVVFQQGYGFADRANQTPFTPQTVFPIGELSMQFTAAATLLLEQQGKLSVQDPLCTYIDPCPDAWKPVTLHHLLSHTSGIPDYTGTSAGEALGQTGATTEQILALIRDTPLESAPGVARTYSRSGFVLLGLVIERAAGQSYGDFMREHVFAPLSMQDSGYSDPPAGAAIGYFTGGDKVAQYDVSALAASGGLYSTSDDLLKWVEGLYSARLLNATQLAKMTTNHASFGEQDALGSGYGIVLSTFEGHRDLGQCGGPLGYGSCIIYVPDAAISIIYLGNQDNADVFSMNDTLEKIALGLI